MNFTAFYTKIDAGYMGQLLEWPEVITEGATLEECRDMLIDAAQEMAIVYQEDGIKIPLQGKAPYNRLYLAAEKAKINYIFSLYLPDSYCP